MGSRQILGIVLLVAGAALLAVGWNASQSVTEKVTEALRGSYSRDTMAYLIGGGAAALGGLLLLVFGRR